nr:AMP-binding protein [Gemmatimonadaceae bacterium]
MSDPLALIPYALAASGGRIDGTPASELVTAGLTLLRRAPALPRAMAGRRAAILLPPGGALVTALAASDGRGAVLLSTLSPPLEIADALADADVGVVFTVASLADRIAPSVVRVLLDDAPRSARVLVGEQATDVSLFGETPLPLVGDPDVDGRDEEALIVYTAAMAGRSLGAILTHRNLLANARGVIIAGALTAEDRTLAMLPFAHLFGTTVAALAPLLAGGHVRALPRFHPLRAVELVERDGITVLVGVPSLYAAMLSALERRGARLTAPALRLCICGGAPLTIELQERWAEATGVELRQGYGLTEAAPVCLFNRVGLPNHRGTLGVPFPGVEVTVRHPEHGGTLPPKVEGEICVRGDNVSPGYLRGAAFGLVRRDGWLHTGDRGVLNSDGTITFR